MRTINRVTHLPSCLTTLSALTLYTAGDHWSPLGEEGYLLKTAYLADKLMAELAEKGVEATLWPPWRLNAKPYAHDVRTLIRAGLEAYCHDILPATAREAITRGHPVTDTKPLEECMQTVKRACREAVAVGVQDGAGAEAGE